jgi:hypothetical protein
MADTCHVCDQFCEGSIKPVRSKCFACGLAVCVGCSTRRKWPRHGVRRICNHCQIDHDGDDKVVMRRLYKLVAGY